MRRSNVAAVGEHVGVVGLPGRWARVVQLRLSHSGDRADERVDDGALADPAGAGHDDDERRRPSRAHPRSLSRPPLLRAEALHRRLSAMPISSITLRALTLPTPGRDSSSETTLSLPTLLSSEAERFGERHRSFFSRALISARAARASAAFAVPRHAARESTAEE
jgi:hypothetical protein